MNQANATYTEQRAQLLRRAALGEDVGKALDKLEADHATAEKANKLASEVAGAKAIIEREQARADLQAQYDAAANGFIEAANHANDAAEQAEKAFADAVTAFDAWRGAVEAARTIGTQAHHLQQQGATPVKVPVMPNIGDLSVHMLRRFGDRSWQESLWGKLPRAS